MVEQAIYIEFLKPRTLPIEPDSSSIRLEGWEGGYGLVLWAGFVVHRGELVFEFRGGYTIIIQ